MDNQNLEHITGDRVVEIAKKVGCTRQYVYMVLNGEREAHTPTAKKILDAAEILNTAIRNGLDGVDKLLITQDDKGK